ncbi:hypothetical protein CPHO_07770 [Corynebacterium phocae]|uniref:Uncharacterized protein n=1 Tax=Corynebacterium phocae TaxID=161895 RepID=A0A1L7D6G3_9CORY|nr:hypothetical protein CPHO_07770 [Corynebacterium phocae]
MHALPGNSPAHRRILATLDTAVRHPRSLARPGGAWRPPKQMLSKTLCATVTRYRVGPVVRARIRGFGQTRVPTYLVSLRITDTRGHVVEQATAESWVRALFREKDIRAVHQLTEETAATFVWLVDHHFQPVLSPASLFEDFYAAA